MELQWPAASQAETRAEDFRPVLAPGDPMIRVVGLSKVYTTNEGPLHALSDINLEVARGEFLSVVGPSGCGKSTLLMLVAGLDRATSGEVFVDGTRVTGPYTDLGIVFQESILLDWRTVLDNVLLQQEIRGLNRRHMEERARDLLKMVGLVGFEKRRPYELSGGMRQRVSICRALVHDPPLLLMDEPFGALDALTREQMASDIQRIWMDTRKTALFVTHSIGEAVLLSDRVVVMSPRPGRVEEVLTIDLPRPRPLDIAHEPELGRYASRIRSIFKARGVLSE
jgi:NitT/TauT family transport system ATP-binding protein